MSSASKTTQCNTGQDESFIHDVFCCISYITHKSPLMQELFSKWLALNSGEAALLNYVSFHIYNTSDMCIYTGIIKGINFWNTIQDTEGACGYHNNLVEFGLDKEQEKQIFKVIMDTSEIISTIVKKAELCEQIRKTKIIAAKDYYVVQVYAPYCHIEMCNATRDIMDCMFEAVLDVSQDPDDIPQTTEPLWLMGKKYNTTEELNTIRQDIVSKLWFTYRRDFVPIGGSDGRTSDKGWGCMLRCGQMVLGQALVNLYLGRDWLWAPNVRDSTYLNIIKKFEDSRKAPFSIHQIASMGVSEGKEIGQWFGPNTVAQVLKKLAKFDEGNPIAIHVALDNVVIISEIKELCLNPSPTDFSNKTAWRPLLLIVPLRLGLSEMNSIYVDGFKKCLHFKQSLGVIGGRPNSALYFIGYVGNEVLYLDPHTTQKAGSVGNKDTIEEKEIDSSYHCRYASRMNILNMDPSVAVCFFCKTESDFNDLCQKIKDEIVKSQKQPLFEIVYEKPREYEATTEDLSLSGISDHSDNEEFEIL